MKLSVIIPTLNEAENIEFQVGEIQKAIALTRRISNYEIIVMDDHSTDETFNIASNLNKEKVFCVRLSKRSGSHTAIRAGLRLATGDAALCISADGQDDPSILSEMMEKLENGSQIVWGMRKARQNESKLQKMFAESFYLILAKLTKNDVSSDKISRADFFLLGPKVVSAVNQCMERNTSLFGLLIWIGFKQEFVEYVRKDRLHGESKWSFNSRLALAKDWLIAFSGVPLSLMSYIGAAISVIGILYAVYITVFALLGTPPQGWASTTVIILVFGGLQMSMLGLIGEYLWRNLEETRKRPLFFIEKNTLETQTIKTKLKEVS